MVIERQERTSPLLLPLIEMMMENLLRLRQIMGGQCGGMKPQQNVQNSIEYLYWGGFRMS